MRKTFLFFFSFFTIMIFLSINAQAQLLVENFDYGTTQNADITAVTSNWARHSGSAGPAYLTSSLSYSSYVSSGIGGSLSFANGSSGTNDGDVNTPFSSTISTDNNVYASFLLNLSSAKSTADYFLHLSTNPFSTSYFRSKVYAVNNGSGWSLGLQKASETRTDNNTVLNFNQTYLVVIKYTLNTASTSDDEVTLYLYDTNYPASEPGSPVVTIGPIGSGITGDPSNIGTIAIRQGSNTPTGTIDGIRVGTVWSDLFPVAGTSTLVTNPTSLSGFSYNIGSGPSSFQSYNLSGTSLTPSSGNITITGSTNYEVSLNNTTYSSSVSKAYTGGMLSSTPVYVRLKAGLSAGEYNGELIVNSGGGDIQNVSCSGAVIAGEPTSYPGSFAGALGNPPYYYNNLTWTDATTGTVPAGYLIKSSYVSFADITAPVDGVPESNSFRIQNIVQGVQSAVFSGYAGSTYYYKIFPYTGTGSNINYKTDGSVPQFSITNDPAPILPLTENFNYNTGSYLTDNGWVAHSSSGTNPITVGASSLTYNGYLNSGLGKSASLTGSGEDDNRAFDSVYSGSLYASFMVNVQSATTTGDYFFHFAPENSTSIFCGKAFVKDDGSGNLAFGISKRNNTSTAVYTSNNYSLNTTYLLVIKYTFNTASAIDDQVSLWVNPVLNGTEPTANVSATDSISDATSLGMFALRQGGSSTAPTLTISGIRIATNWISSQSGSFSSSFQVGNQWNLISFPGTHPNSMSPDTLYRGRDLATPVYKYTSSGYVSSTTLNPAVGYWLYHNGSRIYNWNGTVQSGIFYPQLNYSNVEQISAFAGWNMIGCYEYPIAVSNITTNPAGLITSSIFYYTPGAGYGIASQLTAGNGYWVYMDAPGTIILPERSLGKQNISVKNIIGENWGRIIIKDSEGHTYTLYASSGNSVSLNKFLLPPPPPDGVMDIRYSTQNMVEDLSSEKIIEIKDAVYPITIRVENMSLKLKDAFNDKTIISELQDGKEITISDNKINKISASSENTLPSKFSLSQNYPNPFNPSTNIVFEIPQITNVVLKVYNSLGQEVKTLVNEQMQPGKYDINFSVNGLASGIYYYKIQAGSFVQTKKMILMK